MHERRVGTTDKDGRNSPYNIASQNLNAKFSKL